MLYNMAKKNIATMLRIIVKRYVRIIYCISQFTINMYINRKEIFYVGSEIYYCFTYINGILDILRWFEHVSDEFRMTCIKLKST